MHRTNNLIFNSLTVKIVVVGVLKGTQLINCGIGACFQIESHELHEGQERKSEEQRDLEPNFKGMMFL